MRTQKKIESLQALRGLAFLGILLCHSYNDKYEVLGKWGVSVFLVLSGFTMMYTYEERELKCSIPENIKFSLKKIWKLYPLHVLMTLLAIPLVWENLQKTFTPQQIMMNGPSLAVNLTMSLTLLHAWMPRTYYYFCWNGVAWYLSVSMFLYVMFPFLKKWITGYRHAKTAYLAMGMIFVVQIGAAVAASLLPVPTKLSDDFLRWFTYICPLFRLGDFAIGCHLGYLYKKGTEGEMNRLCYTFLEIVTLVWTVIACLIYCNQPIPGVDAIRYTPLFLPGAAALVYLFAKRGGWLTILLSNRALTEVGNLSAYTFLIHQVLLVYFSKMVHVFVGNNPAPWLPWFHYGCGLVLSLLFARIYRRVFPKA